MAEDRRAYFTRRAGEARTLAGQAPDDRVRAIHLEMAIRYELQAKSLPDDPTVIVGPSDDRAQ
ncbi:hypothetical protein KZX46_12895 [Polymorphobacter sp. PAMC 29334]|uniref:hypothetical protein n=1 Tax=Polymorphobacter sp. PAMC 29334 TaxID=2862331 RepID=UPI001C772437|nr:hypothetical protein [Polymorphobacter sp. PAMC 29334]QYE33743.1 hypothetical protein KZX46_12895 [Polymorphobacter sp. PAMC 29334]